MSAPDEDAHPWAQAAVVTTSSNGHWKVTLGPGPSRLIQAVYAGGPVAESATSSIVKAVVPAKIVLFHVRTHVPWVVCS
jgi:hypothetical protein